MMTPALRRALISALGLTAFTIAFTALMAFTHEATRERIQTAKNQEEMRRINEVLPHEHYDNDLLDDEIAVEGSNEARVSKVWRARNGTTPVALVFKTFAPDGYGGRIDLVVSVDADGKIGGVRVAAHHETPGLGDYIDPAKDRDRQKPWINQFSNADAAQTHWGVKKDGGDFDFHAGATVSARAVTRATGRAAQWVIARRDALFAAPTGSTFSADKKE